MAGHYMVWSVLLLLKIFCFWLVMLLTVSFLTATRCKFFFACDGPCSSGEGKSGWYGVSNHSLFLNHLLAFSFYVLKSYKLLFFSSQNSWQTILYLWAATIFFPKFFSWQNYSVLMSCFFRTLSFFASIVFTHLHILVVPSSCLLPDLLAHLFSMSVTYCFQILTLACFQLWN